MIDRINVVTESTSSLLLAPIGLLNIHFTCVIQGLENTHQIHRLVEMLVFGKEIIKDAQGRLQIIVHQVFWTGFGFGQTRVLH